eukprot:CAMPEP_0172315824 /NCGR_PEP_ID=MMETSP1058-20130122/26404_1 /TAXON_ID=83371 /ORGANISM="Detonula confervacea, Strain CCMP 353" /LENGTH=53 /DNA_ID=CAMNT_0013029993 /DNA_START=33 /DNA_END=191 /DNA_ORIENTATION=+
MLTARFLIQAALLLTILPNNNVVEAGTKPGRQQRKADAREKAVKFANMKAAGQ